VSYLTSDKHMLSHRRHNLPSLNQTVRISSRRSAASVTKLFPGSSQSPPFFIPAPGALSDKLWRTFRVQLYEDTAIILYILSAVCHVGNFLSDFSLLSSVWVSLLQDQPAGSHRKSKS